MYTQKNSAAHKHNIYISCALKNWTWACDHWKLVTCQWTTSKTTPTGWVDSWSGDPGYCFDSCQLTTTCMCNIRLQAFKQLTRKWKISLWCGRTSGRGTDGHAVTWLPNFLGLIAYHIFLAFFADCQCYFFSLGSEMFCWWFFAPHWSHDYLYRITLNRYRSWDIVWFWSWTPTWF